MIVHQVNNPSFAQEFWPFGTVPTLHVSYHLGEHYNSVRLAADPGSSAAIDFPIGHSLKEVEGEPEEEVKEKKEEKGQKPLLLTKGDNDELPTRDELISYACEITGMPNQSLMKTALHETFGSDRVPFVSINEMLQVIMSIYETNEVAQLVDLEESKDVGK